MPTRQLSRTQLRGLKRLGDAYLPGDEQLPSFTELGCAAHVDTILDEMPADDRRSLKLLLGVLAFTPRVLVIALAWCLEAAPHVPGPLGGPLRFLRMGLKGLVLTLYYSGRRGPGYTGRTPLEVLGYRVGVYTADVNTPPRAGSGDGR